MLGVDQKTVQELCRSGRLPGAIKEGGHGSWRIPREAVASWLAAPPGVFTSAQGLSEISGDRFKVGDISGSNVAIGRKAQVTVTKGLSSDELGSLFEQIYRSIHSRPEDPNVDKEEINNTVQNIEKEVSKGETANPNKLERWLKTLALMAPDILDVIAAALLSPGAAVAEVIRKVVAKARQEAGNP
jgi:excisionase family DNA binding protein